MWILPRGRFRRSTGSFPSPRSTPPQTVRHRSASRPPSSTAALVDAGDAAQPASPGANRPVRRRAGSVRGCDRLPHDLASHSPHAPLANDLALRGHEQDCRDQAAAREAHDHRARDQRGPSADAPERRRGSAPAKARHSSDSRTVPRARYPLAAPVAADRRLSASRMDVVVVACAQSSST